MEHNYPHIGDNSFPDLETVDAYKYKNEYDYSLYTDSVKIKMMNVSWCSDYENVVFFESKEERDAWFDKQDGLIKELSSMFRLYNDGSIKVDIPIDECMQYNFVMIDYGKLPQQESATKDSKMFYFVTGLNQASVNATELFLTVDYWTTYINDMNIQYVNLTRGHWPMSQTDVTEYLSNPIENSEYLLTPDVSYGDFNRTATIENIIFNDSESTMYLGFLTNGDTNSATWEDKTSTAVMYQGQQMSSVQTFVTPLTNWATFTSTVDGQCPQFWQTVKGMFVISGKLLNHLTQFSFFGITCYLVDSTGDKVAGTFEVTKDKFGYTGKLAEIAKLYTYPYAALLVQDFKGNVTEIRIEDTVGTLNVHTIMSDMYPFLNVEAYMTGIGGSVTSAISFKTAQSNTMVIGGRQYDFNTKWSIPVFAVQLTATDDWALNGYIESYAANQNALASNATANTNALASNDTANTNALATNTTVNTNTLATNTTVNTNTLDSNATANGNAHRSATATKTATIDSATANYHQANRGIYSVYGNNDDTATPESFLTFAESGSGTNPDNNPTSVYGVNRYYASKMLKPSLDNAKAQMKLQAGNEIMNAKSNNYIASYQTRLQKAEQGFNLATNSAAQITAAATSAAASAGTVACSTAAGAAIGSAVPGAGTAAGAGLGAVAGLANAGVQTAMAASQYVYSSTLDYDLFNTSTRSLHYALLYKYGHIENYSGLNYGVVSESGNTNPAYDEVYTGVNSLLSSDYVYTDGNGWQAGAFAHALDYQKESYKEQIRTSLDTATINRAQSLVNTQETIDVVQGGSKSGVWDYDGTAILAYDATTGNADDTKDTADDNAGRTKDTADANAGRTKKTADDNAGRTKDTADANAGRTKDTADANAGRTFDAAELQTKIHNHPQFGQQTGTPDIINKPFGLSCNIVTQSKNAIRQAGEQFLRYGYFLNMEVDIDSFNIMPNFSFWQCDKVYCNDHGVFTGAQDVIKSILNAGVTVWKDPSKIGVTSIYQNIEVTNE